MFVVGLHQATPATWHDISGLARDEQRKDLGWNFPARFHRARVHAGEVRSRPQRAQGSSCYRRASRRDAGADWFNCRFGVCGSLILASPYLFRAEDFLREDFLPDELDPDDFLPDDFRGTFAPFFLSSDSAIAIACLRLFTLPPFPPGPDLSVPFFLR